MKILDQQAPDNEYLHKDFHGALCYAIHYLDSRFGYETTADYLRQVGETYFAPLSARLEREGLSALEKHLRTIFELESALFQISNDEGVLELKVEKCPAIAHLKRIGQLHTERFCESTVIVNETICRNAGYSCHCHYEPGKGKCVQRFWKGISK